MGITTDEQETHICFMRNSDYAEVYTSDSTTMTKLDKYVEKYPDMWSIKKSTDISKTYICKDKSMIRFGTKKREVSEEQRIQAGIRLKEARERGKLNA